MADDKTYEEVLKVTVDSSAAEKALVQVERVGNSTLKTMQKLTKPVKMVFDAVDNATKIMGKIEGLAMKIVKKPYNLIMGVVDKATPALQAIQSAAVSAMNAAATATAVAGTAMVGFGLESFQAAASVSEMNAALGALAKANGVAQDTVDATVASVKKMGIETHTAQQVTAQFVQNQLDLSQASKLARVAQDAAVIGQTNSSEALERLIHGITTQQTDVLRGIGINVDATKAQEDYAKSIGKTSKQLTAQEKNAAMLNAVLKEGDKIAGAYAAAMEEPGKVLRSFPRLFDDIKVAVGETMLDAFGPMIMSTYNLVKAFDAAVQVGEPLNQIFQAIGKSLTNLMTPITRAIDGMTEWVKSLDQESVGRFVSQLERLAPLLMTLGFGLAAKGGANIKALLGPLGMLIPTINPIVAAVAGLALSSEKARKGIKDLGSAIFQAFTYDAGAIGVVYDLMTELFGPTLANAMQPLLQMLMEFMQRVRDTGGWVEFLKDAFASLRTVLDPVLERLTRLAVNVLGTLAKEMPKIVTIVRNLGEAIHNLIGPTIDAITTFKGWDDVERKIDKVLRKLVKMSERMKDLAKWVGQNTEAVAKFMKVLALWEVGGRILPGVLKGLGVAMKGIGAVSGGIGKLIGIVGKIKGLVGGGAGIKGILTVLPGPIKAIATAFLAWPGPIKIAITAVLALIPALIHLWRTNEDFRAAVSQIWNSIKLIISDVGKVIVSVFQNLIVPAIEILITAFQKLWPYVWPVLQALGKAIMFLWTNVVEPVFGRIAQALEVVRVSWEESGGSIVAFVGNLGVNIVTNLITGLWSRMTEIAGWLGAIMAQWDPGDILNFVRDLGQQIRDGLWTALTSGLEVFGGWLGEVWNAISSGVGAMIENVKNLGGQIASGLWEGLKSGVAGMGDWVGEQAKKVIPDPIESALEIGSPSKVTEELGVNAMQGLIEGLDAVTPDLEGTSFGVGASAIGGMLSGMASVMPQLSQFLSTAMASIPTTAAQVLGIASPSKVMAEIGKGVMDGLIGGMQAAIPALEAVVGQISSTIGGVASGAAGAFTSGYGGDVNQWINDAIAYTGVPQSWARDLNTIIQHESGGDPNAANMWDVNAQAGDASVGLMQLTGSNRSYYTPAGMDPMDPTAQVIAGINYIKDRYGDISTVPGVASVNAGGAYKPYDNGGWLMPGRTSVLNATGQPERVLAPGENRVEVNVGGITINAGPGADGAALAEQVARALAPRLQAALSNMG